MWSRTGGTLSAPGGGSGGARRSDGASRARPSALRSGSGALARRGEPATMLSLSRCRCPKAVHDCLQSENAEFVIWSCSRVEAQAGMLAVWLENCLMCMRAQCSGSCRRVAELADISEHGYISFRLTSTVCSRF